MLRRVLASANSWLAWAAEWFVHGFVQPPWVMPGGYEDFYLPETPEAQPGVATHAASHDRP